ncbi:hypothetical protein GGD83_002113 [Rhodoblastus sphagnicola]|uniref:YiaA/YiaB family inner membrane protein n=1 Tax=Rhodoblastus sphagnicola TaxID=333368 RepID=UPI0017FEEB58|nr:hypothetical protein [Rhodoblastus sphagnicola]
MNQNVVSHSSAWVTFNYATLILAFFTLAAGIFFLPVDLWTKAYLGMGVVMLAQSCVSVTKTARDKHESDRLLTRIGRPRPNGC